jgi:hypothetical protein
MKSSLNKTFNKVPMLEIFVNLTCVSQTTSTADPDKVAFKNGRVSPEIGTQKKKDKKNKKDDKDKDKDEKKEPEKMVGFFRKQFSFLLFRKTG